jgi:membrane protein
MTGFAWMYSSAPTIADPHWNWISAGAAAAVAVWVAASLVLFFFASSFGSYNATYGAFASAILLAVWLWLTNVALLLGADINAAGRYADDRAQHEAAQHAGPSEPPSG